MKVTYIGHSGFSVELKDCVFIFDYYKGELPEFSKEKAIYFFASHKHQDHFSHDIFRLGSDYPKVTYVLSNDIKMSDKYMERQGIAKEVKDKILYVHKEETVALTENIQVETIRSTDEGVAFMITYKEDGGKTTSIYHAGDLNWWTWIGESQEEYSKMTRAFEDSMKHCEEREFDLAMVPLDPRQEDRFWWGFDYFMKVAKVKHAIPMHCWDDYSVIPRLIKMEESKDYRDKIVTVTKNGEVYEF